MAGRHELPTLGVAVWTLWLDRRLPPGAEAALLAADERQRAARLADAADRRRFVSCRAALRGILGALLGEQPPALRFAYGPHGKPRLAGDALPLRFNVAHSGDLALVAVSLRGEVGVDVERVRALPGGHAAITAHDFSTAERESIAATGTSESEREEAFFRHWVLKEAAIKAMGGGVPRALREVEVRRDAAGPPRVLRRGTGEPWPFTLVEWSPRPGFVAALAAS